MEKPTPATSAELAAIAAKVDREMSKTRQGRRALARLRETGGDADQLLRRALSVAADPDHMITTGKHQAELARLQRELGGKKRCKRKPRKRGRK